MDSTSKLRVFLVTFVMALTCLSGCATLKWEGSFNSDYDTQMEYVGRFVFNPNTPGRMYYDIKFPANECCVTMIMFRGDETQWPLVRAQGDEMTCHEKAHTIPGIQNSKIYFNLGRERCVQETDENGQEIIHCVNDKNMFISKHDRWFYFTFMNCHYLRNVGVHVDYKIQVLNGNKTLTREFSADESSNLAVTFISAVVLTTLIIVALIQTVRLNHQRKLHTTYRIWLLSIFAQYIGVIISFVAFLNFALDGWKREESILAAHIFTSVGNVIFTVILILIGKGYTITRLTIRPIGVTKIWLFIIAYSGMFITLYILKDFADPRDVRNIYDTKAAVGLVILRFVALVWVLYGVFFTLKDYPKKRTFYSAFTLFITIWFLSEPLMILLSKYFIPLYCRAKIIYALYLGTAIFGHSVFLCLTCPSTTNKFFPFHLRTNQVNAVPFEYVVEVESQEFDGAIYDIFMTKDERAKKMANQDKIPSVSNIVSEKDALPTTVTYVESEVYFPSSEKDINSGPIDAAKTLRQEHKTPLHLDPEEDNSTSSVQAVKTNIKQPKSAAYLELEKAMFPVQEIPSVRNPERMYPSSESDEDLDIITLDDIPNRMAAKNQLPEVEINTSTTFGRSSTSQAFPAPLQTTALAREAAVVYKNRTPLQTNIQNGDEARKPASRAEDAQRTNISSYLSLDRATTSGPEEESAQQQADLTTPAVVRNEIRRAPSTFQCEQEQTTKEEMADQPPPIPKKKKHQTQSAVISKELEAVTDTPHKIVKETTAEKQERIRALRAALQQAEAEYEMDQLLTQGAPSEDMEAKRQRRRKMQQDNRYLKGTTSEVEVEERRGRKMRAEEMPDDTKPVDDATSAEREERRRRRAKKMLEKRQLLEAGHQEDVTSGEIEREEQRKAQQALERSKSSEALQEGANLPDTEKEERRKRIRAKRMLEKMQAETEMQHQEQRAAVERKKAWEALEGDKSSEATPEGAFQRDAERDERRRRRRAQRLLEKKQVETEMQHQENSASAKVERDERIKAREAQERGQSSEALQEGADQREAERDERRRRRRAQKLLEKRQSSELPQEGANSARVDRDELKKRAWNTPEEQRSSGMLRPEGDNLADVEKEERRKRIRAKRMLEKRGSSEVLHQESDAASAEAEREERRRRRRLRKNLEARRQAELETEIE